MKIKASLLVDLACIALIISFALVIALPRWRAGMDWGDEGFLAYGAVRVMHGEIPHRDFVSLQPPLSFYTAALIFKIFGTSLGALRILGLSIFLLIPLSIFGIARGLTKPTLALAAALPAVVLSLPLFNFVPFAVWQGIAATLVAAFLYTRAIPRNHRSLAFASGIFTAASLLLRHDQAVYFIGSITVLTLALRFVPDDSTSKQGATRAFRWWLFGIAAFLFPLSIYWWIEGALSEMFRQLIVFPATTYAKTSSLAFPRFAAQTSLAEKATALLFYVPPFVQAVAAIWLGQRLVRRRFYRREAMLLFLLVWSALFYLQVLTRSDVNHLLITFPPTFLLAACCWRLLLENLGERTALRVLISIVAATAVSGFVWLTSPITLPDTTKANELLDLNTGGVRIDNGKWLADFVRGVRDRVPPDRSILSLPYQPMLYFLCERRNPSRWNYLWPGDQTAQEHVDLIEQARRDPPAVIFITGENEMANYASDILDYVHADYQHAADFGRMTVYFPRAPADND